MSRILSGLGRRWATMRPALNTGCSPGSPKFSLADLLGDLFSERPGYLPMVLGLNIDFLGREVTIGAPSTQWWTQLATAIAGGLAFATVLTLVLTPCLLLLGEKRFGRAPVGYPDEIRGHGAVG